MLRAFNSIFQAFGEMLLFNLLMLCLAGVIVEGTECCFQRDCSHLNMACMGAGGGCSLQGTFGGKSKRGICVQRRGHGSKVGFNSDDVCTSGEEQCAYCSDTCGTSKGCNVVPQCNWDTNKSNASFHTCKKISAWCNFVYFQMSTAGEIPIAKTAYIVTTGDTMAKLIAMASA